MRHWSTVLLGCAAALPGNSALGTSPRRAPADVIVANDNRQPAGTLRGGVLTVALEARRGTWYPEGPNGSGLPVEAWGEPGRPLQDPGPLVRVRVGTTVRADLHNTLDAPLVVYGFGATKRGALDSIVVAPGETKRAEFKATTPGTFWYAGKTIPHGPWQARAEDDSQLNGAIVVDPADAPPATDRVFMISFWVQQDSTSPTGLGRATMAINGLSWPHTERVDVAQGDSLRWRVINLTPLDHPMHLHGFYFRVNAKGDGNADTLIAPADQRLAVTEAMAPGQTMDIAWKAVRSGNWIFHCHYAGHVSTHAELDTHKGVLDEHDLMRHGSDAPHQMYGLVLGIRVAPRGEATTYAAGPPPRAMRLIVRERPNVYGSAPGFAYVLGGTPDEANADAMPVPGPTLVLERNQPVAITIVNHSHDPTAVHWHGIELMSFPDGVPGWSGSGTNIMPSIAPGDSLTVHFTPPRAGTFMYHSHFNEARQINSGLYGAIVVLDRGERFDTTTDRILLLSNAGQTRNVIRGPFAPVLLNGQAQPAPIELKAGTSYRFRVLNIADEFPTLFTLARGERPVRWRAVAKDGADLPPSQATERPAVLVSDPGEIYDFRFTPAAPGDLAFRFGIPPFLEVPGAKPTVVPVVVK